MAEMPWIKSYPSGIHWNDELPRIEIASMLQTAASRWPQRPAVTFMGRTITYAELSSLVDRAATGLRQLGVKPGVHVGLYLPNVPQYLIGFFAILRAGGTVVNYSPLDAGEVLAHKVEDSRTDVLVTLDEAALYSKMGPLLGKSRLKTLVVGQLGEFSGDPQAVRAGQEKAGSLSAVEYDAQCIRFASLLDNDGRIEPVAPSDPAGTVAVLQYTGGTTGLPKGAMLTHANLAASTGQIIKTYVDDDKMLAYGRDSFLTVLPLFHVYAMVADMLFPVAIGAEIVLHVKFDPAVAMREISERRIAAFPGVPTMFTAVANHPDVERYDLRSLKVCCSGGAPAPVELLHRFIELTGCTLTEGWGMTETSSTGTFTPTLGKRKAGSCGIPQLGVTIQFLDTEDPSRVVPMGERGEIAIKGPIVMKGYWNNEKATRESFTADGYFRTGDVGYMDEDGYMYIVDRTKDMLLCGGFNVYPRVIEEAIYTHPSVAEVLVIGIPDAYRGESPKAYVALRPGQEPFTIEQLKEFLKNKLGKHEMVQAVEFRDALPKTSVGKLSKKMLKDELAGSA